METAESGVAGDDSTDRQGFASALSVPKRLLILAINYWPLLHLLSIACVLGINWSVPGLRIASGLAILFLLPPITARLLLFFSPIHQNRIEIGTRDYFIWWALSNLQMIFCRLSFLEEFLRMVPGAYSMWLRLWGARIGRLCYWGAGLRILDRSFLLIGDDVVFGAGVRLNSHVIAGGDTSGMELILAPIRVGDRVVVGGYSLLTAGTEIAPDECTRAFLISPPFSRWKDGARIREKDQN